MFEFNPCLPIFYKSRQSQTVCSWENPKLSNNLNKNKTKNIPLKLKPISLGTISVINLIKCGIMYVFQIIVYLSSPSIYGSRCLLSLITFLSDERLHQSFLFNHIFQFDHFSRNTHRP